MITDKVVFRIGGNAKEFIAEHTADLSTEMQIGLESMLKNFAIQQVRLFATPDANNWLPFKGKEIEFSNSIKENGDCWCLFDDNTVCKYYDDQPLAIMTHWKPLHEKLQNETSKD